MTKEELIKIFENPISHELIEVKRYSGYPRIYIFRRMDNSNFLRCSTLDTPGVFRSIDCDYIKFIDRTGKIYENNF